MQIHYVVFYDTATEKWHYDSQIDAYFPDGVIWNHAGSQEWDGLNDDDPVDDSFGHGVTIGAYFNDCEEIVTTLNDHYEIV